jgi:hypothetical protein
VVIDGGDIEAAAAGSRSSASIAVVNQSSVGAAFSVIAVSPRFLG